MRTFAAYPAYVRTLAGIMVLLLVGAGCGEDDGGGGPCTLIGAESGITLQLHRVLTPHPGVRFRVKTCLDSACTDHVVRGRAAGRATDLGFGGQSLNDGSPRMVSVTITDESGRVVFDGRREVRAELSEPNGPDCDPHVWVAALRAVGTNHLVVIRRPE